MGHMRKFLELITKYEWDRHRYIKRWIVRKFVIYLFCEDLKGLIGYNVSEILAE